MRSYRTKCVARALPRRLRHRRPLEKSLLQSRDLCSFSVQVGGCSGRRARIGAAALVGGCGEATFARAACSACLPCSSHRGTVRLRVCSLRSSVLTACARLTVSVHGKCVCCSTCFDVGHWSSIQSVYRSDSSCRCSESDFGRLYGTGSSGRVYTGGTHGAVPFTKV